MSSTFWFPAFLQGHSATAWPWSCAVCRLLQFTGGWTGSGRGRGLARGAQCEQWLPDCAGLSGPHPITLPHCFPRVPLITNYLGTQRVVYVCTVQLDLPSFDTRVGGTILPLLPLGNDTSRRGQPEAGLGAGVPSCPPLTSVTSASLGHPQRSRGRKLSLPPDCRWEH